MHLTFDRPILRGVNFDLAPGTTKVVLGGSGSGKTTILRLILGLLSPESGTIHVNGQRIDTMTKRELMTVRTDIGMLFQETALFIR